MKILIQSIFGHRRPLLRSSGCRYFTASPEEEYAKRNYANNLLEYNTVIGSIVAKRRPYLLRDVYDDMLLDGVPPTRDTFNSLIVGTMRGSRLQDAFFFRDEMRKMGLVPDVNSYNFLISTCGKCHNSDHAVKILEEMKKYEVKPNGQTYVCLLNACAATANLDQVYAIIRDMTAAGAGLNNFCYAELITAYMNKRPVPDDATMKIIEFVEQSRGWFRVYLLRDVYDDMMLDGVHPTQDTFNSLIVGTMRGARLQDDFFFRDEMGKMGFVPDVNSYNFLISTCGKCQNSDHVVKILEEIKKYDVKPNGQTYVCLLNACAATANLDQVLLSLLSSQGDCHLLNQQVIVLKIR